MLSTAHGLLGHAEQVQAAHAVAAARPDLEEEALAVGDGLRDLTLTLRSARILLRMAAGR